MHFGALEVAQFGTQALDAAAGKGEGGEIMSVAVALDNLGGNGVRFQAEEFTGPAFDIRGEEGVGAHRAGNFGHADIFHRSGETIPMALEFGVEARELEGVGRGFGVNAVGTPHADQPLVREAEFFERVKHQIEIVKQQLARANQQQRARAVHNVRGGAAEVDKTGCRPDFFFQRGKKGDDVVAGGCFDFFNAFHVNGRFVADGVHIFGGNDPLLVPCFAYGDFDLKPGAIAAFQRPQCSHFGPGVACDHDVPRVVQRVRRFRNEGRGISGPRNQKLQGLRQERFPRLWSARRSLCRKRQKMYWRMSLRTRCQCRLTHWARRPIEAFRD